jgi:hypothetical protein
MAIFSPAPQKKKVGKYVTLAYISTSPTNSRQESVIWFFPWLNLPKRVLIRTAENVSICGSI